MPEEQGSRTTGAELIARERERQKSEEGWTAEHDRQWRGRELIRAAICYAKADIDGNLSLDDFGLWPWDMQWWKPKSRIRNLVKAGALIAAEIDRLFDQEERDFIAELKKR